MASFSIHLASSYKSKSISIPSTILLAATVAADSKSTTTFPGRCTTTADCYTYGENYACVSVGTIVAGMEHLSLFYSCGWNTCTHTLCSGGQGTCSPMTDFAQEYECNCYAGYHIQMNAAASRSEELKEVVRSRKTLPMVNTHASRVRKATNSVYCVMPPARPDVVCTGHGTCGTNGACTCSANYNGTFCGESESTGIKRSSTTLSAATSVRMEISFIAFAFLMTFFASTEAKLRSE
ncbi:hypothetical protein PsorP6_000939 [Peronosclerospora sorghi]|uniref:Uncharacterized protein n=1 Tax=Peronosclerospora sorghi TaxID=230839 RepID=A0ACC0WV94_9STRA|nr:hypothetical protein PsorP6_000939 [Peronosclerospora sorghi]